MLWMKYHSSLIMDEWCAVCHPSRSAELSKPSQSRVLVAFESEPERKLARETERWERLFLWGREILNGDCFRARGRWLCTSCYRYIGGAEHRGAENRWRQNHGPGLSQADGLYRREGRQVLVSLSLSLSPLFLSCPVINIHRSLSSDKKGFVTLRSFDE